MAAETTGVAVAGIKSGALASLAALAISVMVVALGLVVMPPRRGHECRDIGQRMAAGLLCSYTLGPPLAIKAFEWWPGYLTHWQSLLPGAHPLWAQLMAATPFIALTALPGFWIVAGFMRWFTRRAQQDIAQMLRDAKDDINPLKEPRP